MSSAELNHLHALGTFLLSAEIPHFYPDDPDYTALQASYTSNPAKPAVIIRPRSAEDVAEVVQFCSSNSSSTANGSMPCVIRAGGHDLAGRHTVADAVQIDLRLLDSVAISPDKKTARIGGGILLDALLTALEKEGLTTVVGGIGTVGYVGWATFGGYGDSVPGRGLGCDQIVAAKVVNAEGCIQEASGQMLKAIRGGGPGNWGVITELTIKIYPLQEIQAGMIIFDPSDLRGSISTYLTNYASLVRTEQVPTSLYLQPMVFNLLGMGTVFMVSFVWTGSTIGDDNCKKWQAKIAGLANCIQQTVATTTPLKKLMDTTAMLPLQVHGGTHTVTLGEYSAQAVAALVEVALSMPKDLGCGLSIHALQPCSPSSLKESKENEEEESVYNCRQPHMMLELVGFGTTEEAGLEGMNWAAEARAMLSGVDAALDWTYFSLAHPDHVDLNKMYTAEDYEVMKGLKKEVDPKGVFRYALPQVTSIASAR
ncbi:d-lactate dehydrogenase [Diplogelasinospora grovesii]|uniref:D-lactate dehydrogenase n=1 Tax=Diplogelasinospora grovesii TaxID=303347 RepID=A0AAN6NIQ0_9PEZI|nr:d-lactate dehydrogenase [Diplogelasinospora grovesii]